jgi:hypothetical protein
MKKHGLQKITGTYPNARRVMSQAMREAAAAAARLSVRHTVK